jgi:hypothetical protein
MFYLLQVGNLAEVHEKAVIAVQAAIQFSIEKLGNAAIAFLNIARGLVRLQATIAVGSKQVMDPRLRGGDRE